MGLSRSPEHQTSTDPGGIRCPCRAYHGHGIASHCPHVVLAGNRTALSSHCHASHCHARVTAHRLALPLFLPKTCLAPQGLKLTVLKGFSGPELSRLSRLMHPASASGIRSIPTVAALLLLPPKSNLPAMLAMNKLQAFQKTVHYGAPTLRTRVSSLSLLSLVLPTAPSMQGTNRCVKR